MFTCSAIYMYVAIEAQQNAVIYFLSSDQKGNPTLDAGQLAANYCSPNKKVIDGVGRLLLSTDIAKLKSEGMADVGDLEERLQGAWKFLESQTLGERSSTSTLVELPSDSSFLF